MLGWQRLNLETTEVLLFIAIRWDTLLVFCLYFMVVGERHLVQEPMFILSHHLRMSVWGWWWGNGSSRHYSLPKFSSQDVGGRWLTPEVINLHDGRRDGFVITPPSTFTTTTTSTIDFMLQPITGNNFVLAFLIEVVMSHGLLSSWSDLLTDWWTDRCMWRGRGVIWCRHWRVMIDNLYG